MNDAIPFKPNFRSFQEGEEIQIRLLNQPTYIQKKGWKPAECTVCRDFPELTHKGRMIPVFTAEQNPNTDQPKHLLRVKDTSPLYNAKHLILRG